MYLRTYLRAARGGNRLIARFMASSDDAVPPAGETLKAFMDRKWKRTEAAQMQQQPWPTDRPLESAIEAAVVLDPHWGSLERRVTGRKPRRDGPSGRLNLRKSEEDYWLEAGVYGSDEGAASAPDEPPTEIPTAQASEAHPRWRSRSVGAAGAAAGAAGAAAGAAGTAAAPALASGLKPGSFVRHSTVSVRNAAEAAALAKKYSTSLAPAAAALPGFQRAVLLHDTLSSTVTSLSCWETEKAAAAAGLDEAYTVAAQQVASHFAGPPAVAELVVLGEFGPLCTTRPE